MVYKAITVIGEGDVILDGISQLTIYIQASVWHNLTIGDRAELIIVTIIVHEAIIVRKRLIIILLIYICRPLRR